MMSLPPDILCMPSDSVKSRLETMPHLFPVSCRLSFPSEVLPPACCDLSWWIAPAARSTRISIQQISPASSSSSPLPYSMLTFPGCDLPGGCLPSGPRYRVPWHASHSHAHPQPEGARAVAGGAGDCRVSACPVVVHTPALVHLLVSSLSTSKCQSNGACSYRVSACPVVVHTPSLVHLLVCLLSTTKGRSSRWWCLEWSCESIHIRFP